MFYYFFGDQLCRDHPIRLPARDRRDWSTCERPGWSMRPRNIQVSPVRSLLAEATTWMLNIKRSARRLFVLEWIYSHWTPVSLSCCSLLSIHFRSREPSPVVGRSHKRRGGQKIVPLLVSNAPLNAAASVLRAFADIRASNSLSVSRIESSNFVSLTSGVVLRWLLLDERSTWNFARERLELDFRILKRRDCRSCWKLFRACKVLPACDTRIGSLDRQLLRILNARHCLLEYAWSFRLLRRSNHPN
jgi:hypothetical protein